MLRESSQCVERKKLHNDGFYSEIREKTCKNSEMNSRSSSYVSNFNKNSPKTIFLKLFREFCTHRDIAIPKWSIINYLYEEAKQVFLYTKLASSSNSQMTNESYITNVSIKIDKSTRIFNLEFIHFVQINIVFDIAFDIVFTSDDLSLMKVPVLKFLVAFIFSFHIRTTHHYVNKNVTNCSSRCLRRRLRWCSPQRVRPCLSMSPSPSPGPKPCPSPCPCPGLCPSPCPNPCPCPSPCPCLHRGRRPRLTADCFLLKKQDFKGSTDVTTHTTRTEEQINLKIFLKDNLLIITCLNVKLFNVNLSVVSIAKATSSLSKPSIITSKHCRTIYHFSLWCLSLSFQPLEPRLRFVSRGFKKLPERVSMNLIQFVIYARYNHKEYSSILKRKIRINLNKKGRLNIFQK